MIRTILLFMLVPTLAVADDWPHWRGPERTDITAETSGWDEGARLHHRLER